MQAEWTSPDDKIFKAVLVPGMWGQKPCEGSTVKLNIINCPDALSQFNDKALVIGDNDGELGRLLDICISTMHLNERASFTITVDLDQISAVIELKEFEFCGFIFQWDAKQKYDMALKHKEKGARFFAEKNQLEAAHRFIKALKIISSIPIDVEYTPDVIDNINVSDIKELKEKLYNNLSSCYFREQMYDLVIPLCEKVLAFDKKNIKALYKIGVAYEHDKNFEKAREVLSKVMEIEPQNKACAEHLANVNDNLKKANTRINDMMKKMIVGSVGK